MDNPSAAETFKYMEQHFNAAAAQGVNATLQWELSGEGGGTWALEIANGACKLIEGGVQNPKTTFILAASDWVAIATGKLNPMNAFMTGKLKVQGDQSIALKMQSMFPSPS
jgi:putative sterol carrier protein